MREKLSRLSHLIVDHDSVSRQHATLVLEGSTILVEDRNSGNGTSVNDRTIPPGGNGTPILPGDRLTLGEVTLVFEITN